MGKLDTSLMVFGSWVLALVAVVFVAAVQGPREVLDATAVLAAGLGIAQLVVSRRATSRAAYVTQNQLVSAILESADAIIWCVDRKGTCTFAGGGGYEAAGFRPADRVGTNFLDYYAENPVILGALRDGLRGHAGRRLVEHNSELFELNYNPLRRASGEVSGLVGIMFNVTAQHATEQALRISEESLRTFFDSTSMGAALADLQGTWTQVNQTLATMLGYTPQELVGMQWKNITHPDDAASSRDAVAPLLAGEVNRIRQTKRYLHKSGATVWVDLHLSVVRHPDTGVADYFIAIVDDVTERKRAAEEGQELRISEQAAREASLLKSQFIANTSHEIRTPLNGIVGMTSLLRDTPLNEEQRDYLNNITRSTEALLSVINDILDFSKIESGKIQLERVVFNLQQCVEETERMLSFAAQKKAIRLAAHVCAEADTLVYGDPGRLRQILVNLIYNAIKFTREGRVDVRVALEGSDAALIKLRFEIQDTGVGIPRQALSRLFQAFSQADAGTSRRFGGTGLGLSISKQLVELMGGSIHVNSEEGHGATFSFVMQFERGTPLDIAHGASPRQPTVHTGATVKRILVAEDNVVNQIIAVKLLEKLGYRATAVANGHEVLDALREVPYDLILMDCQMPGMDGYETTRIIRTGSTLECPNIPIVAMTANAMGGEQEKCIAAGMNGYLVKPVDLVLLSEAIAKFLNSPPAPLSPTPKAPRA